MKPTERTLKYFRDQGYICDMIERWIRNPKHPAGGFRKDFLGFGDILAFNEVDTILIQSCGSSFSSHRKDMLENPNIGKWIHSTQIFPARRVVLMGWRKVKLKRGGKALRWKPRIAEFFKINGEIDCKEEK